MKTVQPQTRAPIKNDNLKNLKALNGKGSAPLDLKGPTSANISEAAKALNTEGPPELPEHSSSVPNTEKATSTASSIAKTLTSLPVLPIAIPSEGKDIKKLEEKILDKAPHKLSVIRKPAVIFIEGFSAFGISNGDGIKDMADNLPGAKRFSWNEQDEILEEIKKHAPDQPVVLVGHSFGGDSAIEIANSLNSVKNGFRGIDLLISIDSVGINHSIIPMNVKRNLNFFGEGLLPFLHGDPHVARNTAYTDVLNELRPELHSRMEDSDEIQFKIFESINEILGENNQQDLFVEMQKQEQLRAFIDNQLLRHSKD